VNDGMIPSHHIALSFSSFGVVCPHQVPLWLAIALRKYGYCRIIIPEWMEAGESPTPPMTLSSYSHHQHHHHQVLLPTSIDDSGTPPDGVVVGLTFPPLWYLLWPCQRTWKQYVIMKGHKSPLLSPYISTMSRWHQCCSKRE